MRNPLSDGPLAHPAFRRAVIGRVVSSIGTWMQLVAAGWLVYDLTGSAAAVGALTLLGRGPTIVFSELGGVLADRFDRRRLVSLLSLLQVIPAAALAVIAWEDASSPLEIYVATVMLAIPGALASPALQAVGPQTLPESQRASGVAWASAAYNGSRLIGPAAGGVLVAGIGPGPCFALNALSFLGVVAAMRGIQLPPAAHHVLGGARDAMGELRKEPVLLVMVGGAALFATLAGPVQELMPAISKDHGEEAHYLGFLLSALAAGGILGNWFWRRLRAREVGAIQILASSAIAAGLALALLGLVELYPIALLASFACGVFLELVWVETMSDLQLEAPPEFTGRLVGLYMAGSAAGLCVGALGVGGLLDWLGPAGGLGVAAGLLVAFGLWQLLWPHTAPVRRAAS